MSNLNLWGYECDDVLSPLKKCFEFQFPFLNIERHKKVLASFTFLQAKINK